MYIAKIHCQCVTAALHKQAQPIMGCIHVPKLIELIGAIVRLGSAISRHMAVERK